jgi:hypothetical protein
MLSKLNKIARKRSAFIRESETGLMAKSAIMQDKLESYVIGKLLPSLDVKNSSIVNSSKNIKLVNSSKNLKKFLKGVIDVAMFDYYDNQFSGIQSRTNGYYNEFNPSKSLIGQVNSKGQLLTDGVLDSLFDNNQILRSIQNSIRGAVASTQKVSKLKTLLETQIQGREDKFGLVESYHYNNGYDKLQSYSRTLDEGFSKALKLNYAIYAGGEIETTRDFCNERNGNVYNRETIEGWNELDWKGKIQDGNVLIDAGGYNCRHDYDWISYQLAKRVNSDIEKSTYDKK